MKTIILFIISLIILFIAKIKWRHIFTIIAIALICGCIGLAVDILLKRNQIQSNKIQESSSKFSSRVATTGFSRVKNFLSNDKKVDIADPKSAIGDGGLFGTFPGNSKVKFFLENSESDYIFSILVEEGGVICGVCIILVYILFLIRIMIIALRCEDLYGKILSFGLGFIIIFQAFIHICVAVGLIPKTGEQLPFVSRGGTSLLMACLVIGILQNIASQNVIKVEEDD